MIESWETENKINKMNNTSSNISLLLFNVRDRRNLPQITKNTYDNPKVNIRVNGEKWKTFPLKLGTLQVSTLTTLI